MQEHKKHNHQIEINDLIDDAINNAVTRRGLLTVSDDEATSIAGGLTDETKKIPVVDFKPTPIIVGKIAYPPITIGLIAIDPTVNKAPIA